LSNYIVILFIQLANREATQGDEESKSTVIGQRWGCWS